MIIKQAPYSRYSDRRWDSKIELKTPRKHLARCQPEFLINDFPAYWNRLIKKPWSKEHTGCRKGQSTIKHLPPSQYQQSLGLIRAFSLCLNSHSMPCTSRRTSVCREDCQVKLLSIHGSNPTYYMYFTFSVKQKPKEWQTKSHFFVRKYVLCTIVGARQVKSGTKKSNENKLVW